MLVPFVNARNAAPDDAPADAPAVTPLSEGKLAVAFFGTLTVLAVVCKHVNQTVPEQALGMLTIVFLAHAAMLGRMHVLPAGVAALFVAYAVVHLPVDEKWYWQRAVIAKHMERHIVNGQLAALYLKEQTAAPPSMLDYITLFGKEYDPKNMEHVNRFF